VLAAGNPAQVVRKLDIPEGYSRHETMFSFLPRGSCRPLALTSGGHEERGLVALLTRTCGEWMMAEVDRKWRRSAS
jgi:hypothetical protein